MADTSFDSWDASPSSEPTKQTKPKQKGTTVLKKALTNATQKPKKPTAVAAPAAEPVATGKRNRSKPAEYWALPAKSSGVAAASEEDEQQHKKVKVADAKKSVEANAKKASGAAKGKKNQVAVIVVSEDENEQEKESEEEEVSVVVETKAKGKGAARKNSVGAGKGKGKEKDESPVVAKPAASKKKETVPVKAKKTPVARVVKEKEPVPVELSEAKEDSDEDAMGDISKDQVEESDEEEEPMVVTPVAAVVKASVASKKTATKPPAAAAAAPIHHHRALPAIPAPVSVPIHALPTDSEEVQALRKTIQHMQLRLAEIDNLRETVPEQLLNEFKATANARFESFERKITDYKTRYTTTKQLLTTSETTTTTLRTDLETCRAQLATLQKSAAAAVDTKSLEQQHAKQMNACKKHWKEKVEALERECAGAKEERDALRGEVEEGKREVDGVRRELEDVKKKFMLERGEVERAEKEVEEKGKRVEEVEKANKALVAEVNAVKAKLTSLEQRSVQETDNRSAQPDRYTQTLERMVRMYEELTQCKIQSVDETRAEIDSDDEEDEEQVEQQMQDEIDKARRRSVRRQSVGKSAIAAPLVSKMEDVLEHRCSYEGTQGAIVFSLTVPKVQTETSSPSILYTLHLAKDETGATIEEEDEVLPEFLNGEMTFPRDQLGAFFRKTCEWLFQV
ncbi:hypothetical protein HDU98_011705 [Podochytrium sp. JEL0797]|nr:hypothetical protein HDU98_011705 [Podochytrium sp. JEL0797]